ncbi:hypothetical protein ACP4OV_022367 [Aristida adscensionis]
MKRFVGEVSSSAPMAKVPVPAAATKMSLGPVQVTVVVGGARPTPPAKSAGVAAGLRPAALGGGPK